MERIFLRFTIPLLLMMGYYTQGRGQDNSATSNPKKSNRVADPILKRDHSIEGIRTYHEYKNGFLNYNSSSVKQWQPIKRFNSYSTDQYIIKGFGNLQPREFEYLSEDLLDKRTYEYYYHAVDGINPTRDYDLNIVPYLFMELGKVLVNEIQ